MNESAGTDPLAEIVSLEKKGDFLRAHDLAKKALEVMGVEEGDRSSATAGASLAPTIRKFNLHAVECLANAGSVGTARDHYEKAGLRDLEAYDDDVAALAARLERDAALMVSGEGRATLTRGAAERYRSVFLRTGGVQHLANAATLFRLAGDTDRSETLAREVLGILERRGAGSESEQDQQVSQHRLDDFCHAAVAAQAHLLLGDVNPARTSLQRAVRAMGGTAAARSEARVQLSRLCQEIGVDVNVVLAPIKPLSVAHYCGHMAGTPGTLGRFPPGEESRVAREVEEVLADLKVGVAYGSLAAGADLIIAELILRRGGELHVVLPFGVDEFIRVSVEPFGEGWVERFHVVLKQASSTTSVTDDEHLSEDTMFAYCSRYAVGRAVLHARAVGADAVQIAVWDGATTGMGFGTAADVAGMSRPMLK